MGNLPVWLTIVFWVVVAIVALLFGTWTAFKIAIRRGSQGVRPVKPADYILPLNEKAQVKRISDRQVDISWEPTLEVTRIDFNDHTIIPPTGSKQIVVDAPVRPRPIFSIHLANETERLKVSERALPLPSVVNIRDIGGYMTESGTHQIRWNRVYRTGELSKLTDEDTAYLLENRIKWICDLRSDREIAESPDRVPRGAFLDHNPVNEGNTFSGFLQSMLFNRSEFEPVLSGGYRTMITDRAHVFGRWLKPLADEANLPAIIHCTAGKDRTGVGVAILLALLGVPRETIIADYSQSNLAFEALSERVAARMTRFIEMGVPFEDLSILFMVKPEWLEGSFAEIDAAYPDIETFVKEACGLSQEEIDRIREHLLEPIQVEVA